MSPGGAAVNMRRAYAVPPRLRLNQWALSGEWTLKTEAAVLNAPEGESHTGFTRVISTSSSGHPSAEEPFVFEC